jgi:predicted deacylase
MGQFPGPRSISGYVSATLGLPSIVPNVGGAGFAPDVEAKWIDANVNGALGVMKHLGMLRGEPARPSRFFHFETRGYRVVPRRAGLLLPRVGPDRLVTEIAKGTVLGEVISPYTFETLEQLVAPVDGVLFGVGRLTPLRPGDWAYFVAEGSAKSSRWVSAGGSTRDIATRMLEGAGVTNQH